MTSMEQKIESELAVFWDEISKFLPKSKERKALGDDKIFKALRIAYPGMRQHLMDECYETIRKQVCGWFDVPLRQIVIGKYECDKCGGNLFRIRSRYPHGDKRDVCPTCAIEILESLKSNLQPAGQSSIKQ